MVAVFGLGNAKPWRLRRQHYRINYSMKTYTDTGPMPVAITNINPPTRSIRLRLAIGKYRRGLATQRIIASLQPHAPRAAIFGNAEMNDTLAEYRDRATAVKLERTLSCTDRRPAQQ